MFKVNLYLPPLDLFWLMGERDGCNVLYVVERQESDVGNGPQKTFMVVYAIKKMIDLPTA